MYLKKYFSGAVPHITDKSGALYCYLIYYKLTFVLYKVQQMHRPCKANEPGVIKKTKVVSFPFTGVACIIKTVTSFTVQTGPYKPSY